MSPSTPPLEMLFRYRWAVRVMACLAPSGGSRFVVMKHALGVSADQLTRELGRLTELGLVRKNPGYGHPLRPEYILTPTGVAVAPACEAFARTVQELDVGAAVYRKWSVPVLRSAAPSPVTFTALRTRLTLTPRALTQSLGRLTDAELLARDGRYLVTPSGSQIARAAHGIVGVRR